MGKKKNHILYTNSSKHLMQALTHLHEWLKIENLRWKMFEY